MLRKQLAHIWQIRQPILWNGNQENPASKLRKTFSIQSHAYAQKKHTSEETLYKVAKEQPRSFHSPSNAPQYQFFFSLHATSALFHHVSLWVFLFLFNCGICVIKSWTSNELWHMRTNCLMSSGMKVSETHYPHSISEVCSIWAVSSVASIQHKAAPQKTRKNSSKQKQNNKFS